MDRIKDFLKNSDLLVALGLVFILAVMIIPISPLMMDFFIGLTLALSIVILLLSVYIKRPLDFSTFPSVLLVATLFRLSLNVASTRNILIRGPSEGTGATGEIVNAFGNYVVGGNFAVGIIVFIIFVIINFIVITKGAGRVSEVAARFTLDAMPGKQMAIDADLNAGLINEEQAKLRRQEVAQEADFYGSMDGSSKFVRGDAIAGILITAVNIIGGIIIGVAQQGLDFQEALEVFTLLTIGDGLVAQIPALIISTAAGLISTRNTNEKALGSQLGEQFAVQPKALYITSGIIFLFSFIPGFPTFVFLTISSLIAFTGFKMQEGEKQKALKLARKENESIEDEKKEEKLEDLLGIDILELNIGYGLVSIVDSEESGELLERINQIRKQFATQWGVIVPSVQIRDDLELEPGEYCLKIKGVKVANAVLRPDHLLAMDPGTVIEKINGIETREPVFGLDAVWISEDDRDDAQYNGYTVVDISTVIATHLTEMLKTYIHEIFGRVELQYILEHVKESYPKLVDDLIPDTLTISSVLKVVRNLLRENISIRDMRTILESLSEYGAKIKNEELLTEKVRESLYRTVTEQVKSENGEVPIFMLDKHLEKIIIDHVHIDESGEHVHLDTQTTQSILAVLNEKIEEATSMGEKMVVMCSPIVRRHFKKLTEKFLPSLIVIGHNEIAHEVNIKSMGTIRI